MKIKSFCLLASLMLFGCTTVEYLPQEPEKYSIRATMEVGDTKTSVTDAGYFTWSAGDKIWLHTTGGGVEGVLSTGAGTANATFTYGPFVGTMSGKAVYPYNEKHAISDQSVSIYLPASYDLGSVTSNTNAVMYAEVYGGNLKFSHLAGVMRFEFKNAPAGTNQFKITLDKKINGSFAANISENYHTISTSETSVAAEKTVVLNFDALTEASDIYLYVPLPVGTYNSLELELNATGGNVWSYSKSVTNTINRRSLLLMPAISMGGSIGGDIENDGSIEGDIENEVKVAPADQIWYTATEKVELNNLETGMFGMLEVKSHDYDPSTQKGVIIFTTSVPCIPRQFFKKAGVVTDIVLPEDLVYLENSSLAGCNFTSVTIPSYVQGIEADALTYSTLKELNVLTTQLNFVGSFVDASVLEKITGPWASKDGRFLIDDKGNLLAAALSGVTELSIPDGVKAIKTSFGDPLIKVTIPSSVTDLGEIFTYCTTLKEVHINSQNLKGESNPFYGCSSLEKFSGPLASADGRCLIVNNKLISLAGAGIYEYAVPEGIEEVVMYVWYQCKHFKKLTIPSTATSVDYMDSLTSLESLYCLTAEPPYGLYHLNRSVNIYVPSDYYSNYLNELGSKFKNIYTIE